MPENIPQRNDGFDEILKDELASAKEKQGLDALVKHLRAFKISGYLDADFNPEKYADVREQLSLFVQTPGLIEDLKAKGLWTEEMQKHLETPLDVNDSPKSRMADAIFCFLDTQQITKMFAEFLFNQNYATNSQTAHKIAEEYVQDFGPDELMFL
jgi:hypothetical protein